VCYGGLHVNWDLQVFGKRSARVIRIICPLGYGSSDLVYFDFYMFNKIVNYTVRASWSFVFTKPLIQLFYPYPKHSVHTVPSQISQVFATFHYHARWHHHNYETMCSRYPELSRL
jgi:hypothetical protein